MLDSACLIYVYTATRSVIFSGKRIYRYTDTLSSKSDEMFKSVIPDIPAYFIENHPSGMFMNHT